MVFLGISSLLSWKYVDMIAPKLVDEFITPIFKIKRVNCILESDPGPIEAQIYQQNFGLFGG